MRGAGRIFKRANSSAWWIAYCHRAKEIRESSGSNERKVAERLLKRRLIETGADSLGLKAFVSPKQDRILVSELLDYLEGDLRLPNEKRPGPARSLPGIRSHLKRIRAAFGDWRAVGVTREAVDRYIETRLSDGAAPAGLRAVLPMRTALHR